MRDPWKYVAFPAAAIAGYLLSTTAITAAVGGFTGTSSEIVNNSIIVGLSGLVAGFLVDEVIPAYLEKVRSGRGGELGGGDFDSDMDFGE